MEARPTQKQVITSSLFWESYDNVYVQGLDLFGFYQAELYANKIKSILYELDQTYPYYPECRHLTTKSRMYRNKFRKRFFLFITENYFNLFSYKFS